MSGVEPRVTSWSYKGTPALEAGVPRDKSEADSWQVNQASGKRQAVDSRTKISLESSGFGRNLLSQHIFQPTKETL